MADYSLHGEMVLIRFSERKEPHSLHGGRWGRGKGIVFISRAILGNMRVAVDPACGGGVV